MARWLGGTLNADRESLSIARVGILYIDHCRIYYNEQPWSYIVAVKHDEDAFQILLSCLVEGNQGWASAAPVLAIGCTSLKFTRNGQPNAAAVHDLGLASANLTFEATARGLFVHQMIGILPDKARELYRIPEDV